ncbi:MAG: hypothetical protein MdMp024_0511 [Bacteroidales bacterium]
MGYIKGQTGNPNGRPKGSKNKATTDLREWIKEVLDSNREQFIRDLQEIEPHQRLALLEKLLSYAVPKIQSAKMKEEKPVIRFFFGDEYEEMCKAKDEETSHPA